MAAQTTMCFKQGRDQVTGPLSVFFWRGKYLCGTVPRFVVEKNMSYHVADIDEILIDTPTSAPSTAKYFSWE